MSVSQEISKAMLKINKAIKDSPCFLLLILKINYGFKEWAIKITGVSN
jgi:hypothetical protein